MFTKYLSVLILSFLCAFSLNQLSAQEKKESYKVVVIEKSVDENGNVTENKVVKEGDEAKEYIDKNVDIDIKGDNIWITDEGEEINLDGKKAKVIKKKQMRIAVEDEDGEEKIIEWDGEGEMPEEMKQYAEEFGLSNDMDGDIEKEVEVMVRSIGDSNDNVIKIISDGDGEHDVYEIKLEGDDIPEDMMRILKEKGIDLNIEESHEDGERKVIVMVKDEDHDVHHSNKAQLGVFLGGDDNGVLVEEIVPESAAEEAGLKAGDVITAFGDQKVSSVKGLVNAVSEYAPGDKVTVQFIRDKKNMSKEVTLKKSKDMEAILDGKWKEKYEFKHGEDLEEHMKKTKEKRIEKKVIIKKKN